MVAALLSRFLHLQVIVFGTIAALGLAAIPIIVLVDLVSRRSFGGLFGAIELVEYTLLLATLAACPVLTHHHAHVGGGMTGPARSARRQIVDTIGAVVSAVLAFRMVQLAAEAFQQGREFRQSFDVPEVWIWCFGAWAFGAMALDLGLDVACPERRARRG